VRKEHDRVNAVAWAALVVVAGSAAAAAYYAMAVHANPVRCVFADAQCTQAVATYLLCLLSAGAFFATAHAVIYTKYTYDMSLRTLRHAESTAESGRKSFETSVAVFERDLTPIMALQICRDLPDQPFLSRPGRPPIREPGEGHLDTRSVQYFLNDLRAVELSFVAPSDCVAPTAVLAEFPYVLHHFDVQSLGRAPVINGFLLLSAQGRREPFRVDVGSIAVNAAVHLVVWVERLLDDTVELSWSGAGTDSRDDKLRYWLPPDVALNRKRSYLKSVLDVRTPGSRDVP